MAERLGFDAYLAGAISGGLRNAEGVIADERQARLQMLRDEKAAALALDRDKKTAQFESDLDLQQRQQRYDQAISWGLSPKEAAQYAQQGSIMGGGTPIDGLTAGQLRGVVADTTTPIMDESLEFITGSLSDRSDGSTADAFLRPLNDAVNTDEPIPDNLIKALHGPSGPDKLFKSEGERIRLLAEAKRYNGMHKLRKEYGDTTATGSTAKRLSEKFVEDYNAIEEEYQKTIAELYGDEADTSGREAFRGRSDNAAVGEEALNPNVGGADNQFLEQDYAAGFKRALEKGLLRGD